MEGYVSELWDFTHISVTQNNLQELKEDLILAHLDTKKRVDVFALSIYGLVIFPKALGHIDEAVSDLFDQLDKRVTPVPVESLLSSILRELLSVERIRGYAKARRHFKRKMDGNSP
ncbi:hypothetical protein Gotri_014949, partial [Gossypium trilobum]|nr:hypothetical protein [Gossypium trilobum]